MKDNYKVIIVAMSLILAFSLVLATSLYAPGNAPVSSKALKNEDFNPVENIIGTPISQSSMQERFSSMSETREENGEKSITVITEETLYKMWDSMTDENYKVYSLSTEEVLYIISDSIRLYYEYDEIILSGYVDEKYNYTPPKYSNGWFGVKPGLQADVIYPIHDLDSYRIGEDYFKYSSYKYSEEEKQKIIDERSKSVAYGIMINEIYKIITYRIKALSSPACFATLGEAAGITAEEWNNNTEYKTKCYIPGFTSDTDRAEIINQLNPRRNFTDTSNLFDFFKYDINGTEMSINLISNNWETTSKVFPTAELEAQKPEK